jgi:hypothetical protein
MEDTFADTLSNFVVLEAFDPHPYKLIAAPFGYSVDLSAPGYTIYSIHGFKIANVSVDQIPFLNKRYTSISNGMASLYLDGELIDEEEIDELLDFQRAIVTWFERDESDVDELDSDSMSQ